MTYAIPIPALKGASSLATYGWTPAAAQKNLDAGCLAPWQAKRSLAHIEAHLDGRIRIGDLAALTRLSHSYYTRAFRETFGCSPRKYILDRRVSQAQALMLETGDPLCGIAQACGFCDQAHLSRIFRRFVGQSPNAWRRARHDA